MGTGWLESLELNRSSLYRVHFRNTYMRPVYQQKSDTMKALVIYYSQTGHTKAVAEAIADMLSCDKEKIVDSQSRSGPVGFLRSGFQARRKSLIDINPIEKDVSQYDLVIVGTPVWAGNVSSPVRTFLHKYKDQLKDIAFFSTHGGDEPQKEFSEMEITCGKKPISVLSLSSGEVERENYSEKVKSFIGNLKS